MTGKGDRNPKFKAIIEEILDLHDAKSHDYSEDADPLSNLKRCQAFGVRPFLGVMVRLTDKWSRLEQLVGGGKTAKNESIRDSLIDNAIYSLLAVVLFDEETERKKRAD